VTPQPSRWGPWVLDTDVLVLRLEDPGHYLHGYEVDLEWWLDSAQVADWIFQILHKDRSDKNVITGLVNALDDVLHPQRNLCAGSRSLTITAEQVRQLAGQAVVP
jgi:hypothetical protein